MENQGSQSQGSQSQNTTQSGQTAIPADGNWHDFKQTPTAFKSPVGCEINPLAGNFGQVRSLESSGDSIEVTYNQG
jgi:hypothetical protein